MKREYPDKKLYDKFCKNHEQRMERINIEKLQKAKRKTNLIAVVKRVIKI